MCEAEGLAKPLIILDIDPLWGAWPTVKGSEGTGATMTRRILSQIYDNVAQNSQLERLCSS